MDLGLTLVQAKAYLALCRLDCATIKSISKMSNLARQDVYRIMPSLQKMGLVEQVISNPTKYHAVPIKKGVYSLLQHHIEEQEKLTKKTTELLNHLKEDDLKTTFTAQEEPQLLIISELSLLFKKLMNGTRASQVSIDSVGTWEAFDGVTSNGLSDFKKALHRGVRIKSITERPPNGKSLPSYVKTLQKHPLYEVRFVSPPAPITMAILDKREVSICISAPAGNSPSSLWSSNRVIVNLALNYFEEIWNKASKSIPLGKRKELQPNNLTLKKTVNHKLQTNPSVARINLHTKGNA
ncbi:MAG: hypothetical protein N3D85_04885 [Candidatus Bathyarchaeota archaeon]|nr:hypothetical protein [Candidatus Bathyarchaeota archaeon]